MTRKKTALITGASSGIGKEIAIQLAEQNIKVCINFSKSSSKAKKVKNYIEKLGGEAIIFQADVTNEHDVKKMFNFLSKNFKKLDYLINNAGIGLYEKIENSSYKKWNEIINVNLNSKYLCTKYFIPLLKQFSNPCIINIASRIGTIPICGTSAYCCAESAIIMLSKVSALELSEYGIKVNTISPGLIKTSLTEKMYNNKYFNDYAKKNPLKRLCKTENIANAVSFLISDKANFINGENINVSGGMLLK